MVTKEEGLAWALERGLVQSIFAPCAEVAASFLAEVTPLARILDVGCGSGIALRIAALQFASIIRADGIDISEPAIAIARAVSDPYKLHFAAANAETYTTSEPYDAALCQHTIQHIPDQPAAMRALRAALRPGGRLVLTVWPELADCPAYDFLYTAAGERAAKAPKLGLSLDALASLAHAAGLRVDIAARRDVGSRPVMPETLLAQYLASSHAWNGRPPEQWPRPTMADLHNLALRLGWSAADPRFRIGINVVVATRPA